MASRTSRFARPALGLWILATGSACAAEDTCLRTTDCTRGAACVEGRCVLQSATPNSSNGGGGGVSGAPSVGGRGGSGGGGSTALDSTDTNADAGTEQAGADAH